MATLAITDERAFDLLEEYAGLYGDNGGDPDMGSSTYLPSSDLEIPEDLVGDVVAAGYGHLVHGVRWLTDWQIVAKGWDLADPDSWDCQSWTHYGTFGTPQSVWAIIP